MSVLGAVRAPYRAGRRALSAMGLDVRLLRNEDRKVFGAEVRLGSHVESGGLGEIVNARIEGQPVSFFVRNTGDVIQKEHKKGLFYEPEELAIIGRHFKGGLFVDIGANIGNHAIYAARFLGARAVIAVEPNPAAYQILRVNLALNDLSGIVRHEAVGLSFAPGRAALVNRADNLGATRLEATDAANGLPVVTGDALLAGEDVAFLKIDTEGMEIDVLRGLAKTIKRCRPPMFVEVDDRNAEAFKALLAAWGYVVVETFERYATQVNYLVAPAA